MADLAGINAIAPTRKYDYRNVADGNKSQQEAAPAKASSTDKVTISAEAQMANDLEKLALPDWITSYMAPINNLNHTAAIESARKANAIFDGVNGDQKAAQQFMDNDPAIRQLRHNLQIYSTIKPDLDQYGKYQKQAMDAAMQAIGVDKNQSYYDVTSSDPSAAERAHSVYKQVLTSMPNVKSSMSRLDVPAVNDI